MFALGIDSSLLGILALLGLLALHHGIRMARPAQPTDRPDPLRRPGKSIAGVFTAFAVLAAFAIGTCMMFTWR